MSQYNKYDVSILTVVYNNAEFIADCLASVQSQKNVSIQHIIVDGGSTDRTLDTILNNIRPIDILISEPDNGVYDALNKGVSKCDADLIGILHSDDVFASEQTVSHAVSLHKSEKVDLIYGDLIFIDRDNSRLSRRWTSSNFRKWKIIFGWMPPHPTCFYDADMIAKENINYDVKYKISGDYDYLLKILTRKNVTAAYIPGIVTIMRSGGISNGNIKKNLQKFFEDLEILTGISPLMTPAAVFKRLIKIKQIMPFI